jgi:dipeptidyl aminopeptidase/acylaminoacyl peptidase
VRGSVNLKENREVHHLWLTEEAAPRQLTRGLVSDRAPQVSPDGRWVVFLSDRPLPKGEEKETKGPQLWALPLAGGEPYPLTAQPRGVEAYAFADAKSLIFLAEDLPDAQARREEEAKDETQVVEDAQRQKRLRLFRLDLAAKKVTRLTTNSSPITQFAVSPDGAWVALQINVSPSFEADARIKPENYLLRLADGQLIRILAQRPATPTAFRFTPDGRYLAFSETFSSDPQWEGAGVEKLYRLSLASLEVEEVPLAWPRGLASAEAYAPVPGGFLVLLADGTRNLLAFLQETPGGFARHLLSAEHVAAFVSSRDGRFLAIRRESPTSPPQWVRASFSPKGLKVLQELTDLNPSLKDKPMGKVELLRWPGAQEETVEGILYYPFSYQPGQRYPLVVMIHGGPAAADQWEWKASWAYAPQLYAQRGAFVLLPNYHGSSHYGLAWVESIKGRYYELEVPDILKGVDHLVASGLVDPERLGVLGWSNGAILTIALTVSTSRFKAAAAGAGDVNWISDYGTCAFGVRFDSSYFGGAPWERLEHYLAKSPLFQLAKVTTPTLIFFGTEDTSVPTEQGWQHFRALQQIGKAPVRFLLFPGEGHSLAKPAHRLRKLREELAWFDRYLFVGEKAKSPLPKPGSPLDLLLAQKPRAQQEGVWGVLVQGKLLPETVEVPELGLKVAPFEMTRAQWAAFDPGFPLRPGEENLPAIGIAAEKAQEYCRWASQLTGRSFRLPTLQEWERLQGSSEGEGVSLAYWLKETPAFDDLPLLWRLLAPHGGVAALLRPVGSGDRVLTSQGSALFDLNGNAAEWVIEGGKPVLKGGCAACFEDQSPPLELAGFRLVEETRP